MGVDWDECDEVARLIGLKTVVNEFVAYAELASMLKKKQLSVSSPTIIFVNCSTLGSYVSCRALGYGEGWPHATSQGRSAFLLVSLEEYCF